MTHRPPLAAALALVAGLACAGGAPAQPVRAVAVDAQPARPAESGGHDSAATMGPLAIGAAVRDPSGAQIGHLVLLTTDSHNRSVAKVRANEDIYLIPVADLYQRGGEALCTLSLAAVQRDYAAP